MVGNQKKFNKLICFDISENNLICVEAQFTKDNVNITNGFKLNIPIFQDINQTINYIKQNLKSTNIKTKDCTIGLSMQYFKLFPVTIPRSIPQDEINSIILQEGSIDPNNYYATWIPLNNTQRQDPDGILRFDILGISVQKQLVDFAKLLSKNCNLNLISLTPSFVGLGALLTQNAPNNLQATLWVSQIRSEFVVWTGQEPIYEHLFLTHQMSEQIFQSVNYIQSQLGGIQISIIYSCGPYIKETNLTQTPFNIQPFTLPNYIIPSANVLQRINISEIVVAVGVALSSSNNFPYTSPDLLFPVKTKQEGLKGIFKEISKPKGIIIKGKPLEPVLSNFVFGSILIVVLSLFGSFFIQSFLMPEIQGKEAFFQNRITLAQGHLAKVLNFEKNNKVLKLKVDFLSELIDKRKPWSKILQEIANISPKGLWIDRLEIRSNNIDIFGRALDVDSVANFSINLNYNAKFLTKAQIITLRKFQEEGIELVEFQLSTRLSDSYKTASSEVKSDSPKASPKT